MSNQDQIRRDRVTREWVIYSRSRAKRPHDLRREAGSVRKLPRHQPDCPFCPGNEDGLGEILFETPGSNKYGWFTRVIANKYPALVPEGSTIRRSEGLCVSLDGFGRHEVIIDSPRHDRDLAAMDSQELAAVVATYHQRYLAHTESDHSMMTIIFRNHGVRAGTSLIHPHSQVVTTPVVPAMIRLRETEAQRYWDSMGRCVYCQIMEEELSQGKRLLRDSPRFLAFVPFAARVPMEMWVMPKRHAADFGDASQGDLEELAEVLGYLLGRLHDLMNDPDYNLVINTAARHRRNEPYLHWYLTITPRLTTMAGFEIGSGMNINPSLPEDDARFLNQG
jgi:UDPglucose--hexose-1-phosphate uridylyltransferase